MVARTDAVVPLAPEAGASEAAPASEPTPWRLADGAQAELVDGGLELRDADGRLLFRYLRGAAELAAPQGDLSLGAPSGRVVVRSGTDLELVAGRDVRHQAGQAVSVRAGGAAAPQLSLDRDAIHVAADTLRARAERTELVSLEATLAARTIITTAERIAERVGRYELTATRLLEQARDAFHEVTGRFQSRVGSARTVVRELYELRSRRTVLRSEQDTVIDGKPVRLG